MNSNTSQSNMEPSIEDSKLEINYKDIDNSFLDHKKRKRIYIEERKKKRVKIQKELENLGSNISKNLNDFSYEIFSYTNEFGNYDETINFLKLLNDLGETTIPTKKSKTNDTKHRCGVICSSTQKPCQIVLNNEGKCHKHN